MDHQVERARELIRHWANEGVIAISPIALARELTISNLDATKMLDQLQRTDSTVYAQGYFDCPACRESIALDAKTMVGITNEASGRAESDCPWCGAPFGGPDNIEVSFSFFFSPVARSTGHTVQAGHAKADRAADHAREPLPVLIQQFGSGTLTFAHGDVAGTSMSKAGGDIAGTEVNKAGGDISGRDKTTAGRDLKQGETNAPQPWYKDGAVIGGAIAAIIAAAAAILIAFCAPKPTP